ncbi:zinc-binding dehydrogenase [Tabrizicola caldifontis]|uniref:zinc-binding dehydrogenase n=1 Tax=Tabrizicola caldifontis TaxID=2528036 RepID=UPI00107FF340|nr:zinc-binding dehydrogenase [Rhodobacter sp. YIM 73028]
MNGVPATMSAVQLVGHGGPEMLVWRDDLPVPRPGPGEVLVRVLAAGVNMTDINTRLGWYGSGDRKSGWAGELVFPRIQGSDLCGRIVALGPGVGGLSLGARVICPTNQHEPTRENPINFASIGSEFDGAFADYCLVKARHLHDVSASPLTDIEIGAMPCAYGTAENLLSRAEVARGERVLVTGASGGVGLAAVQLALLRGAEVTAQCSPAKSAPLRALGAAILPREATPPARAFDVVVDVVGGDGFQARLDALRPGGRYATSGAVGGPLVSGDLRSVYLNDLTLFGATHQPREVFARLVSIINSGGVRPVVSKTYPLRDIAQAQADLATGRYPGKLVLVPSEALP